MLSTQMTRTPALTGLSVALALVTAANVAAYPPTPEGDPLPAGTPVGEPLQLVEPGAAPGTPVNDPLAPSEVSSSGVDWSGLILLSGVAGLAVLAVIAAAVFLTAQRGDPAAN